MTSPSLLFEKFEISSCLKQDEFSAVYLARHVFLGKEIILKVLNTQTMREPVVLERFKREARILARLDHPNIIKVIDFGMHEHNFYISFEYFESRNLRQTFAEKELTTENRRMILSELLESVRYAHQAGIIHRDIKPENILIGPGLAVKLSDFGLAEMNTDSLVTDKFGLVGTPGYMSPEQIRGEKLTPKSDLFACGIVACELFTGVHPFLGRDINESLNAIVSFDEGILLEKLSPLPPDLKAVVYGLLRKKTSDRWHDAGAALHELGLTAGAAPPLAVRAAGFLSSGSRKALAVSVGLVLVTTFGYFILQSFQGQSLQGRPSPMSPVDQNSMQNNSHRDSSGPVLSRANSELGTASSRARPTPTETKTAKVANGKADIAMNKMFSESLALKSPVITGSGELYIECLPWARVSVDSVDLETTPLKRNLRLSAGRHQIELVHPRYPVYASVITILPNTVNTIRVNLDTLFGYLGCEVIPWAEIYVDGTYLDRTPLAPIRLIPGKHHISLKNKGFEPLEKDVLISRNDTAWVRHHFSATK